MVWHAIKHVQFEHFHFISFVLFALDLLFYEHFSIIIFLVSRTGICPILMPMVGVTKGNDLHEQNVQQFGGNHGESFRILHNSLAHEANLPRFDLQTRDGKFYKSYLYNTIS